MEESAWSSKCWTFKVSDSFPRGRPREKWNKVIRNDLKERGVSKDLAKELLRRLHKKLSDPYKHRRDVLTNMLMVACLQSDWAQSGRKKWKDKMFMKSCIWNVFLKSWNLYSQSSKRRFFAGFIFTIGSYQKRFVELYHWFLTEKIRRN